MFLDNEQLKKIMAIAKQAGDAIVSQYHQKTDFKMKEDDTPFTEADILSHEIITKGLSDILEGVPILSEESGHIPFSTRRSWGEYWLIDPLDGTRGFIDKTDDFCICISYLKNNEVVFGLIYLPLKDTYYVANSRDVAYKVQDTNWQQLSAKTQHTPIKVLVGRYSVGKKQISQHLNAVFGKDNYEVDGIGSAIKFCLIAEGLYDYYPALGVCSEWDTSAGGFILRSAGGYVYDLSDNPLKYNTKNDLLSPMFLASGDFKVDRGI